MIYLDYNATTPIAPSVTNAMMPYIKDQFGNPGNAYPLGQRAKQAVRDARLEASRLLGCRPDEIVFTGGGSESNNTAIKGIRPSSDTVKGHIITTAVEHPSVIHPAEWMAKQGWNLTVLPVDQYGIVDPDDVKKAITPHTVLISVMHANNETGSIQPIRDIGVIAGEHGVLFHTDAAQSIGKIEVRVDDLMVDMLTLAGHKLYAPKGIGLLYVRDRVPLDPLIHGGGQEMGKRAGTENVIFIVGLGEACRLAGERLDQDQKKMRALRNRLHQMIVDQIPEAVLNGHPDLRLPNTLNLSFPHMKGVDILKEIPVLSASVGAACKADSIEPSQVLTAMGVRPDLAAGAVRLSLGRYTTESEIVQAGRWLIHAVKSIQDNNRSDY